MRDVTSGVHPCAKVREGTCILRRKVRSHAEKVTRVLGEVGHESGKVRVYSQEGQATTHADRAYSQKVRSYISRLQHMSKVGSPTVRVQNALLGNKD